MTPGGAAEPGGPIAPVASAPPPRRRKSVLRRTLSGGALVATVSGLLWWNAQSGDGRPLYFTVALVLIAAVIETARMGALAQIALRPALLLAAVGALLFLNRSIEDARPAFTPAAKLAPVYMGEIACAVVVALAVYGLARALVRIGVPAAAGRLVALAGAGAILLLELRNPPDVFSAASFLLPVAAVVTAPIVGLEPGGWRRLAIVAGLAAWLIPPLPALWSVWHTWGTSGVIALLLCAKIGDTAGYYVGGAIGRTHPFPKISPGKTTAGCVASLAAATAVGGILAATDVLPPGRFGIASGLACGALVNVAAQAGDLLESWVKRRAGVKDSSAVFGPSGGLLDQLDSLLLAVPVALATWPWLLAA